MLNNCPKCLYPLSHPFGLTIIDGECSGCFTHREKEQIDWQSRKKCLELIIKKCKRKSKIYDCVVPIVGDAEDFHVVKLVLELGLAPLIVAVNNYFKNDIGWQNIHQLITRFDVDSLVYNPELHVYKELIKTSFRKFDHVLLPFIQLQTSFPVHVALQRTIPLIVWGQNQAVEQAGKFSHYDEIQMSRWNRMQHDLFGKDISDLIGTGGQVNPRHLDFYKYPDIFDLYQNGVIGIYLSNYYRWDPLSQNVRASGDGFQPESNDYSFDNYERAGDSVYYNIHDLLKLRRCGYRKIQDHIAREIRHGRLAVHEAVKMLDKYSRKKVYIKPFFKWLGASETGYEWILKHRLSGCRDLIADHIEDLTNDRPHVPDSLRWSQAGAKSSNQTFQYFRKGI